MGQTYVWWQVQANPPLKFLDPKTPTMAVFFELKQQHGEMLRTKWNDHLLFVICLHNFHSGLKPKTKFNFQKPHYCLLQVLNSMFLEIFSNRAGSKRPTEWRKYFQNSLIVAFEGFVQPLPYTLCTIFTIPLTLWNSEQKNGLLIKLFCFSSDFDETWWNGSTHR